ncbi:type II toxin-antitoxin system MqsA family antitoxin [Propionivibrio sp.]|uniref:type II toxin-antitoxin system MqsA family antitoxin n=1 Tax=Propionivibrio sp. TaxID=2212460 RepID=UPI003BF36C7D
MSVRKPKYCLQCDDGTEMELKIKDVTVQAHGVTRSVPEVAGWHCPKCSDIEFVDKDGSDRHMEAMSTAWEESRAEESVSLRAIRKKLGLKQADAGRLFGGGVSAFSDYERGKRQPHKSTVLLLKLLGRHPELLKELT